MAEIEDPYCVRWFNLSSLGLLLLPRTHFLSPAKHFSWLMPWEKVKRNFLRKALGSSWAFPTILFLGSACHMQLGSQPGPSNIYWGPRCLTSCKKKKHGKCRFGCLLEQKPNLWDWCWCKRWEVYSGAMGKWWTPISHWTISQWTISHSCSSLRFL